MWVPEEAMPLMSEPKHAQIAQDIESAIHNGDLEPGEALPSYTALMGRYGVARATVRQAISRLQESGVIEGIPGKGCRVVEPKTTWRRIGLASFNSDEDDVLRDEIIRAQPMLTRSRFDLTIRYMLDPEEEEVRDLVEWGRRMDGVLVRARVAQDIVQRLIDAGVSTVVAGEIGSGECPAGAGYVTLDIRGLAGMGVAHLTGLGHKRICLVTRDYSRYYRRLNRFFDEHMERQGLASGATHAIANGDTEQDILEIFRQILAHDPRPTAAFVEGHKRGAHVIRLAEAEGWSVPGDLSVLTIGPMAEIGAPYRYMTMLHGPAEGLLTRGVEILGAMIDNRNAPARWVWTPIEFTAGRTCGPPRIGG